MRTIVLTVALTLAGSAQPSAHVDFKTLSDTFRPRLFATVEPEEEARVATEFAGKAKQLAQNAQEELRTNFADQSSLVEQILQKLEEEGGLERAESSCATNHMACIPMFNSYFTQLDAYKNRLMRLKDPYSLENLIPFSKMIFLGDDGLESAKAQVAANQNLKIIFNQGLFGAGTTVLFQNTQFDEGQTYTVGELTDDKDELSTLIALAGESLKEDKENTDIGYTILMPADPKHVKALFVKVYGGDLPQRDHYETVENSAPNVDALDVYLLNHGIAIAYLSLADIWTLDSFQMKMPKKVHDLIHLGIDTFFHALKDKPGSLHPDLNVFKDKKIFLYGASFGGRTAVRHAELYSKTYSGYISHDGWLAPQKSDETYRIDKALKRDRGDRMALANGRTQRKHRQENREY